MKSPYIMGFQKCGINSLIKWYSDQGIECKTTEDITSIHCIPTYEPFKETHFPVVITRDKVDAIWSIYWFFGYHKSHSLGEFLEIDEPSIQYGNENPINRVDFDYHVSKFRENGIYDAKVLRIDQIPNVPRKNITKDMFDQNNDLQGYRIITSNERWEIEDAINNYNREKLKHKVRLI